MKEFKKIVTKKEEINFSIKEETNGHFVYVPFKENSDHIPGKLSFAKRDISFVLEKINCSAFVYLLHKFHLLREKRVMGKPLTFRSGS